MKTSTIVIVAALALAFLSHSAIAAPSVDATKIPIKHFVYIIQENISFDHYFGTYPGADGIPLNAKFAYSPGGERTVSPFHLNKTSIPHDLNHSWQAAHVSEDGGKMDGFLWGEWPQALAYYWKGTLPQIDPEDIMPVNGDVSNVNGGKKGAKVEARVKQLIATFDKDNDGKLDVNELTALLEARPRFGRGGGPIPTVNGVPITPAERAAAMLKAYDADEDGQLDADELASVIENAGRNGPAAEAVSAGQLPTEHLNAPPIGPTPDWVRQHALILRLARDP